MTAFDFRLLGPVELRRGEHPVPLGSVRQRALLAVLLLSANEVVPTERLIDALWGPHPPLTARQSLHNHVSALRKLLGHGQAPAVLLTRDPGYLIEVEEERLDVARFRRLAERGSQALAADPATAAELLAAALALWRGPALADVVGMLGTGPAATAGELEEARSVASEQRIEAELALGRHREVTSELERLVRAEPLREHLRGQLMLALYRCGRQAEALETYRDARQRLVSELGMEPSVGLQRLEQAILAQDPALDLLLPAPPAGPRAAGGPLQQGGGQAAGGAAAVDRAEAEPPVGAEVAAGGAPPPGGAERKLVTVLLCDVDERAEPARERDPEDVGSVLAEHLERVRAVVEDLGGQVEHVVGGLTMAVFGVPRTGEDDTERAVRAALAMRDALALPAVRVRAAVATGEALVGRAAGGRITGDLVTVCGRLLHTAPPGAVLVSAATQRVTARTISYGSASLLALGGRAEPVPVWSALVPRTQDLLELAETAAAPLAGREAELRALWTGLEEVRARRTPRLVLLAGPAGIGKSRLVAELGRLLAADPRPATWRQGRCPHGSGAPWRALAEIVAAEAGILAGDGAERVGDKLTEAARGVVGDPAEAASVAGHLGRLLGTGAEPPGRESFAAWRRFLHGLAARRPLVMVVEDLHRADEALLEFLAGLAGADTPAGPASLLLVATARPGLLARRPGWAEAGTVVELGALAEADAARLVETLLAGHGLGGRASSLRQSRPGRALLARVAGNPLAAEEYARMLRERGARDELLGGDGPAPLPPVQPVVPETVRALVAARLDGLPVADKAVLADAAVLGHASSAAAVAALGEREPGWTRACLERLVEGGLLRHAEGTAPDGEPAYGFRRVLVMEVAYGQVPRALRAERHRHAAAWLQGLPAAVAAGPLTHHRLRAVAIARMSGAADPDQLAAVRLDLRQHYQRGRWDQAVAVADAVLAEPEVDGARDLELPARVCRGRILLARGQEAEAVAEADAVLALTRTTGDPRDSGQARAFAARALLACGRAGEARPVVDELLATLPEQPAEAEPGIDLPVVLAALGHDAEALGHGPEAGPGWKTPGPGRGVAARWLDAARAYLDGDPGSAAVVYAADGAQADEAEARLAAAGVLLAGGLAADAARELGAASAFWRRVGAGARLREADALLATPA